MSVSVNTSLTASIRGALSKNLNEATRAGISMATGEAIIHAYQDPTGLAIGSNMRAQRDILSIVATGIEQSQSMLFIAEEGLKAAEAVVNQMNTILARAKLGYMNDELIRKTLSPAYKQMQEELNRISDSVNFNGQNLLNGTGGKVTVGKQASVGAVPSSYDFSDASGSFAIKNITGIKAFVDNAAAAEDLTIDSSAAKSIKVIDGTYQKNANGTITIVNAKVEIEGAKVTASGGKDCKSDLQLTGLTITMTKPDAIDSKSTIIDTDKSTAVFSSASTVKFNNISSTGSKDPLSLIENTTIDTAAAIDSDKLKIDNVHARYSSSGGSVTQSAFKFVTGTKLSEDVMKIEMPNIRLYDTAGVVPGTVIPGIISSLNIADGLTSNILPTSLTDLESAHDADRDIPVVAALRDYLVECRNNIGAYELRFVNLLDELHSSVEQTDSAQGAIMNADLPKEAETAAACKVKLNLAIARLNESNQMLQNLQKIVTG